ncbi:MAG TPA: photosynthetic reaction center cytochrome c subunit family protein [Blastocatellia bacterium]|nr:photosynthetic reaction center cytochrome c subunit family protein [Blastocatellia bacterium]
MKKSNFVKLLLIGALLLLAISIVIEARQQQQAQQSGQGNAQGQQPQGQGQQRPPQELKNIQVLKGMTYQQVREVMNQWEKELGVGCNYCHINPFDQDTPRKNVARFMLTQYVNGMKHKDGSAVSCKDCHQADISFLRTRPFEHAVGQDRKGLVALKGMDHAQLMETMQAFTKALNVKCDYCHTGDFGEDTPRKEIARFMIMDFSGGLTKDGKSATCNDCHLGRAAKILARLPRPQQQRPPANNDAAPKKPTE